MFCSELICFDTEKTSFARRPEVAVGVQSFLRKSLLGTVGVLPRLAEYREAKGALLGHEWRSFATGDLTS
jgi:hypothetical protein